MKTKALKKKKGATFWKSLSPRTKWELFKANTGVLSRAAFRNIKKKPQTLALAGTVVAGAIAGTVLLTKKK
ncbi:hypothetical protein RCC89_02575 [Cytophagaceae bacterium ABcell3]|nr:hypothetical protein RCC89_02575 [Cytophagaceae bacterium ABcell3]